jgi:hypothetical protein
MVKEERELEKRTESEGGLAIATLRHEHWWFWPGQRRPGWRWLSIKNGRREEDKGTEVRQIKHVWYHAGPMAEPTHLQSPFPSLSPAHPSDPPPPLLKPPPTLPRHPHLPDALLHILVLLLECPSPRRTGTRRGCWRGNQPGWSRDLHWLRGCRRSRRLGRGGTQCAS